MGLDCKYILCMCVPHNISCVIFFNPGALQSKVGFGIPKSRESSISLEDIFFRERYFIERYISLIDFFSSRNIFERIFSRGFLQKDFFKRISSRGILQEDSFKRISSRGFLPGLLYKMVGNFSLHKLQDSRSKFFQELPH